MYCSSCQKVQLKMRFRVTLMDRRNLDIKLKLECQWAAKAEGACRDWGLKKPVGWKMAQ